LRQLGHYQKLARAKNQTTIGRFSFSTVLKIVTSRTKLFFFGVEIDLFDDEVVVPFCTLPSACWELDLVNKRLESRHF
jgi:hypothetical protein